MDHPARPCRGPAWLGRDLRRPHPVEIIAAFTDALTVPAGPDALEVHPYAPLRAAEWDAPRDFGALASPDGIARVEHLGTADSNLRLIETAVVQDPTIWRAYFTGRTPTHLIAAVTRALADQTPIARDPSQVPGLARDRMAVSTRRVPAADIAFALEHRTNALVTRNGPPPAAAPTRRTPSRRPSR